MLVRALILVPPQMWALLVLQAQHLMLVPPRMRAPVPMFLLALTRTLLLQAPALTLVREKPLRPVPRGR